MSTKVVWRHLTITSARREAPNWHKSAMLRITGLSGAGKSAIAHATEEALHRLDRRTFAFDADSVRHGVSADLGFSIEDRRENTRRIGEMRKLFLEASASAPTALISPCLAVRGAGRPGTDVRHGRGVDRPMRRSRARPAEVARADSWRARTSGERGLMQPPQGTGS